MANEVKYRKIIGCPKHGQINGAQATYKLTNRNTEKLIPCFICHTCKRIYFEPVSGKLEISKDKKPKGYEEYELCKILGPIPLPKKIYIYEKKSINNLCGCNGTIKSRTKRFTHFLLYNGGMASVPGMIYLECKKVFITSGTYKSCLKHIRSLEIEIEFWEEHQKSSKKLYQATENSIKRVIPEFSDGWETAVYYDDYVSEVEESFERLKPANKVASAYYDAKISYNPYQYLPWLKMYMNGANKLLISDEVGLGKTIEAGILMMEEFTLNVNARILVICPAFLREKWYQELNEKFMFDPQIYDGTTVIDMLTNIVILPISRISQFVDKETDFVRLTSAHNRQKRQFCFANTEKVCTFAAYMGH